MEQVTLKSNTEQTYMRILRILRSIIDVEYVHGGRLPASRAMCEKLGCNHITYNKAMACLVADGTVANQFQRGMFVIPANFRCYKVGLILGNGEDSPFMIGSEWVSQLIDTLKRNKIDLQIIQGRNADKILNNVFIHGVSSLVWIGKSETTLKEAQEIHDSGELPIVVANCFSFMTMASEAYPNLPCVNMDMQSIRCNRTNFFIKKGYSDVAYVGESQAEKFMQFSKSLNDSGIRVNPKHLLPPSSYEVGQKLPDILKNSKISCIFSEGSEDVQRTVVECCQKVPASVRPHIVLNRCQHSLDMVKGYPDVKNIYIESSECYGGEICANMMIDYMRSGSPFVTKNELTNYSIERVQ